MVIQEKAGIQKAREFSQKDKLIREGGGAYNRVCRILILRNLTTKKTIKRRWR